MLKLLLTAFPILFAFICNAQFNLVPNYSFEDIDDCPAGISGFNWYDDPFVIDWYAGHGGTSDYFNACAGAGSWVNVPDNLFSEDQPAHTGVAYGGFWTTTGGDYREYVQAQLSSPLVAGECYYVQFWSAPATQSDFFGVNHSTTDAIGIYFSDEKVGDGFGWDVLPYVPQLDNNGTGNYIDQPGEWTEICGYYEAVGGEEWICIGNFHGDDDMEIVAYEGGELGSLVYLFIDDVVVSPVDSIIYLPDTVVCEPFELKGPPCVDSYLWSTGETTQNIIIYETGSYWVQSETTCGLITDTAEVLFVEDSIYTAAFEIEFCFTEIPYALEASPSYEYYLWSTGETSSTIEITDEGMYYVTGFADCATFIDSFNVSIIQPIGVIPELGDDTLICAGAWEYTLSAPDGFEIYEWSTGENTQQIIVHEAGTYSITVSSECESYTDEITIYIDPDLDAQINLGEDMILCPPAGITSLTISTEGELPNYTWNTGETTSSISITEAGTYWVYSELPCGVPSDTVRVTLCNEIGLPNAFSPNGDAVNDQLTVIIVDPSRIKSFYIFDRWGVLVYEGNSANYSWDGKFEGQDQPIGTYIYVLTYDDNGTELTLQGNITLVR